MRATARVTAKGQVTIPAQVRRALGIQVGSELLFEVRPDRTALIQPVRRRRLPELAGALRPTRPFLGMTAVREEVGRRLGESMSRGDSVVGRRQRHRSPHHR